MKGKGMKDFDFEEFARWFRDKCFRAIRGEENMTYYSTVKINNAPLTLKRYIICEVKNQELWFHATCDNEDQAQSVAKKIGGVVIGAV